MNVQEYFIQGGVPPAEGPRKPSCRLHLGAPYAALRGFLNIRGLLYSWGISLDSKRPPQQPFFPGEYFIRYRPWGGGGSLSVIWCPGGFPRRGGRNPPPPPVATAIILFHALGDARASPQRCPGAPTVGFTHPPVGVTCRPRPGPPTGSLRLTIIIPVSWKS